MTKKNSPGMLSQMQIVTESTNMAGVQIIFLAVPESRTNLQQCLCWTFCFVIGQSHQTLHAIHCLDKLQYMARQKTGNHNITCSTLPHVFENQLVYVTFSELKITDFEQS